MSSCPALVSCWRHSFCSGLKFLTWDPNEKCMYVLSLNSNEHTPCGCNEDFLGLSARRSLPSVSRTASRSFTVPWPSACKQRVDGAWIWERYGRGNPLSHNLVNLFCTLVTLSSISCHPATKSTVVDVLERCLKWPTAGRYIGWYLESKQLYIDCTLYQVSLRPGC